MSILIDQIMDALVAVVSTTSEATGGVFEDRSQAYGVEDANAIDISLADANGRSMGDNHPARSVLSGNLQVDIAIYTRAAINSQGLEVSARKLSNPIWASAHAKIMADPTLGGLVGQIRWQRAIWRKQAADGTACWATHSYLITYAMRERTLLAIT